MLFKPRVSPNVANLTDEMKKVLGIASGVAPTFYNGGQHQNSRMFGLGLFKVANMFEATCDELDSTHNGPNNVKALWGIERFVRVSLFMFFTCTCLN